MQQEENGAPKPHDDQPEISSEKIENASEGGTQSKLSFVDRLVKKLEPYHKLVVIIIFFAGGVGFFLGQFVTKAAHSEALKEVKVTIQSLEKRLLSEMSSLNDARTDHIDSVRCSLEYHIKLVALQDAENEAKMSSNILSLEVAKLELVPVTARSPEQKVRLSNMLNDITEVKSHYKRKRQAIEALPECIELN